MISAPTASQKDLRFFDTLERPHPVGAALQYVMVVFDKKFY
jgi:hypothetical protein